MAIAEIGTAATLTYATSSWAVQILSIDIGETARPKIDVSHLGIAAGAQRHYIPGDLADPPELTIAALLDPDLGDAMMTFAVAAPEVITVTFPGAGGTLAGTGFLIGNSWNVPMEERMEGSFTIAFDGKATPVAWAD